MMSRFLRGQARTNGGAELVERAYPPRGLCGHADDVKSELGLNDGTGLSGRKSKRGPVEGFCVGVAGEPTEIAAALAAPRVVRVLARERCKVTAVRQLLTDPHRPLASGIEV